MFLPLVDHANEIFTRAAFGEMSSQAARVASGGAMDGFI